MKIVDSSCLICVFHEINKPFILLNWKQRGYTIIITDEVYTEIQKNKQTHLKIMPEIEKGTIQIKKLINKGEYDKLRIRYPVLGSGEVATIATALKMKQQKKRYYAVIDDLKARQIATKLGVNLTGTFGLLKTLHQKGMIKKEEFDECKNAMDHSNFRINFNKIK